MSLALAMQQSVISVPTPDDMWVVTFQPPIEHVVQVQVCQYRANHAPYAKGNFGRLAGFGADLAKAARHFAAVRTVRGCYGGS